MTRIALKSATYAAMHLTVAVAVAYALTRDWPVAMAVGLVEPLVQTVFFTLHDRLWARADARAARGSAAPVQPGAVGLALGEHPLLPAARP